MIIKVDKYPEKKQPHLSKILDNVLNDAAANETIEKLKEDLTQEYLKKVIEVYPNKKIEYSLKMILMMKILNKIIKSMFDEKEKKFAFI